jgi:hypothetical protein
VGTAGCGFEHQLQSVRVALNPDYPNDPNNPKDLPNTINPENIGFVRPKGYLAVVLITDEDDCSADPGDDKNDSMFLQTQNPITETASLRCEARGHVCKDNNNNYQPIPGYEDPSIGYQPPNPLPATNIGFSTAFTNCDAKGQPNPATGQTDYHYMPLITVQDMIDSVNGVSAWVVDSNGNYVYDTNGNHLSIQKSPDKILVSGIIGWPPDANSLSAAQYQIGIDTTSLPSPANTEWDYMPICKVDSIKSADGNIYKAYGGLRLKKFLDAFQKTNPQGTVQNTFSLCNADFTTAMQQIANAIVQVLKPGCVDYPLIDTQPAPAAGQQRGPVQPECQVTDRIACDTPGQGKCLVTGYQENPLPECIDKTVNPPAPLNPVNPALGNIPDSARPCWYLYYDKSPTGCPTSYLGQRITALRKSGTTAPAGTLLGMQCLTCAKATQDCPPLHQ